MSFLFGGKYMPKVSTEYLKKKRSEILEAAYTVCMKKPLHQVSMRDVINESGFSPGGVYRYFSNFSDILIALVDRDSYKYDIVNLTDRVLLHDDIPERVLGRIFTILGDTVIDNLIGVGKIFYESLVVYAEDPKVLNRFYTESEMVAKENYIKEKALTYVEQKITEGYFKPQLPSDALYGFLFTAIDGIIRDTILIQHYQMNALPFASLEKNSLIKSLCTAFVLLLGGKGDLIYGSES